MKKSMFGLSILSALMANTRDAAVNMRALTAPLMDHPVIGRRHGPRDAGKRQRGFGSKPNRYTPHQGQQEIARRRAREDRRSWGDESLEYGGV